MASDKDTPRDITLKAAAQSRGILVQQMAMSLALILTIIAPRLNTNNYYFVMASPCATLVGIFVPPEAPMISLTGTSLESR